MTHLLSSDEWQQHINSFQASNQNKMSYCKQHDLNYHQFLYWHKKLSLESKSLVPVILEEQCERNENIATLYLNSGHKLVIHSMRVLETILSPRL